MKNIWKRLVHIVALTLVLCFLLPAQPTSAASIDIMRMPFSVNEQWKITNGYNSGYCHYRSSPCGGDEYYAFDLIPTSGNAGGKGIYSPGVGKISLVFSLGTGRGWGVKIKTSDGYTIHLYHLMNVAVSQNSAVSYGTYIGQVYNAYSGSINHLHIQVTNSSGVSLPMRFAGKLYYYKGGSNQWYGQILQNNVLFAYSSYSGSSVNFIGVGGWSDFRNFSYNDLASSLRVNPGCSITLYQHINYAGQSKTFTSNVSNLYSYGFDNTASSIKISCP